MSKVPKGVCPKGVGPHASVPPPASPSTFDAPSRVPTNSKSSVKGQTPTNTKGPGQLDVACHVTLGLLVADVFKTGCSRFQ